MKVTAFNGSPRKDGNTAIMLQEALKPIEAAGIQTEIVQVGGNLVHGCKACYWCFDHPDRKRCVVDDDLMNEWMGKMFASDAVLLGSPTYFADVSTEMKALIDRAGLVNRAGGNLLRRKPAAAVVAVRRAGATHAFDTMNHFFLIGEMIVVGSCYWNMGIGRGKGEVAGDEEGMKTMRLLGENMAWTMKKLAP
jgi:multimeric flavodoxin WrbA